MFARALALAWLACALVIARDLARAPASRADASSNAACAACALVVRDAWNLAREPFSRAQVRARAPRARRERPARVVAHRLTRSRSQAADEVALEALRLACEPARARRFERRSDALGAAYYVVSDVPSGPAGAIDAHVARACRRLAKRARAVEALGATGGSRRDVARAACADFGCSPDVDPERPPREGFDVRRDWRRIASGRVLARAAPYFLVAVAAPFLSLPSLFPPSPPPPRADDPPRSRASLARSVASH